MTVFAKDGKHRLRWTGRKWVDGCGHEWKQCQTGSPAANEGLDFACQVHGGGRVTEPEYGDKGLNQIWTVEFRHSRGYKIFKDGLRFR